MTNFEKYKSKMTLRKAARIRKDGGDCTDCPAIKVCCVASAEGLGCEQAFIKWGNMKEGNNDSRRTGSN